jgi:hypothetical protein
MDVQSQSKSQSNKNISPKSPSSTLSKNGSDNGFSKFWEHYPKRVGKKAALTAWQKAKGKPPIDTILSAISQQIASPNWLKDNGQYIPNPATWINQGRWDDDVGVQTSSAYQPQPRRVCPTCGAWEDKCKCKSAKPQDSPPQT